MLMSFSLKHYEEIGCLYFYTNVVKLRRLQVVLGLATVGHHG